MSNTIDPSVSRFIRGGSQGLVRIPPEPASRLRFNFSSILSGMGSLASSAVSSGLGRIDPEYMTLINKQIEMQEQMQLVSLSSNIEKSRHESQMAAIRNVRSA